MGSLIKKLLVSVILVVAIWAPTVRAVEIFNVCNEPGASGSAVCTEKNSPKDIKSLLTVAMNVLSLIAGFAGVLMLIWGGMKYITANGDGQNTARAKDTILFAVIGLAIAVSAQVISIFIVNRIGA